MALLLVILVAVIGSLLALPIFCVARFVSAIFSDKSRQNIRAHRGRHVLLVAASIVSLLLLIGCLAPGHSVFTAKRAKSANGAEQIRTAILAYETEYGEPPSTNKNAALIKILTGHNQRGIEFISVRPRDLNSRGEFLDAWGEPYRVSMADPLHPVVFSTSLYTVPALVRFQSANW